MVNKDTALSASTVISLQGKDEDAESWQKPTIEFVRYREAGAAADDPDARDAEYTFHNTRWSTHSETLSGAGPSGGAFGGGTSNVDVDGVVFYSDHVLKVTKPHELPATIYSKSTWDTQSRNFNDYEILEEKTETTTKVVNANDVLNLVADENATPVSIQPITDLRFADGTPTTLAGFVVATNGQITLIPTSEGSGSLSGNVSISSKTDVLTYVHRFGVGASLGSSMTQHAVFFLASPSGMVYDSVILMIKQPGWSIEPPIRHPTAVFSLLNGYWHHDDLDVSSEASSSSPFAVFYGFRWDAILSTNSDININAEISRAPMILGADGIWDMPEPPEGYYINAYRIEAE